jgi:hypothetical protein
MHTQSTAKVSRAAQVKAQNAKRREILRPIAHEIRSSGCQLCGETASCCLDFHHLDQSTKKYQVKHLLHGLKAVQTALDEIAKCSVICSNCHRKIHAGVLDGSTLTPISVERWRTRPRENFGEDNSQARLTEAIVRQMKAKYQGGNVTYAALAQEYGVDHRTVQRAVKGEQWNHVE